MKNVEIEYKYRATVSLPEFRQFCDSIKGLKKFIAASGTDYFFVNQGVSETDFIRLRSSGSELELTLKQQMMNSTAIRTEHNIRLDPYTRSGAVEAFLEDLGYQYKYKLGKVTEVYMYETFTLCYYICQDEDLKELGRFIEIELNDTDGMSETEAMRLLKAVEGQCKPIRLFQEGRINKSLYEMFKGGLK